MARDMRKQLKEEGKLLGVWGLGFIGYSSMAYFARNGVRCIGTDVIQEKVDDVNLGRIGIPNLDFWLGFDVKPLAEGKMMQATTDWKKLIDPEVIAHLVCIPTEKGGEPFDDILTDVIEKLSTYKDVKTDEPPLVIIESTLTPNRVEKVVFPIFEKHGVQHGKDLLLGVAPRRDWFVSQEKSLTWLPRVAGGTTPETTKYMKQVLGIVCETVVEAPDHKHAAMVKSIENAFRHVGIALANELSLAYPNVDMVEVLRLVGTKWNIETYHPSFGIGGYCIPLAPRYVIMGADKPEKLTILKTAIEADDHQPFNVVESLEKRGIKNVGILGLAYKGDLKVDVLSPTKRIAKALQEKGINVKVNDPYYTDDEIRKLVGVEPFKFPEGLDEFDALLINSDHMAYRMTTTKDIEAHLSNVSLILDSPGTWKERPFREKIEYHEAGDKNWLE